MIKLKEHIKPLLIIFVVAIVARLLFCFLVYLPLADKFHWNHYPGKFNWIKDDKYDEIARNIISGKGYTMQEGNAMYKPNLKRPPVYTYILALQFYLFGDGYWINLLINITYQSLVCIIIYYLALLIFNIKKIAIVASLIWALYPLPMLQAMGPHTEAVYELFLASFTYFFYKFYKSENKRYLVYASIFMVIITLTRPITIFFPLYFLGIILISRGFLFKNKIKYIAIFYLIFVIGISPWMYRAYKITGKFVPLVSYETTVYFEGKGIIKQQPGYKDRLMKELKEPAVFVKNTAERLLRFWYYGHSSTVNTVNALLQFPLLIISISGIWWARKHKYLISPVLLTVFFFWAAYGMTHSISRYSFPMIALLSPFTAVGIINMIRVIFKTKSDFFILQEN